MIQPKLGRDGKRLPASQSLSRWQKYLFFHADVAEQPGSKLVIRSLIDRALLRHSRLQQRFQSPVVFHKKVCDRPCFFVLSWVHSLPPIMLLMQLTSPRADEAMRIFGSLHPR
jgi:hypothetical protein